MKHVLITVIISLFLYCCSSNSTEKNAVHTDSGPITLVIHGGAGTITRANLSPEKEKAYRAKLQEALDSGFSVLDSGGKSVDAVIAAIEIMENSPLFNAGKGAVFTHDERNELDASIMDGSNLMAGAVAGVTTIKNPIAAAYAVMAKSNHVMLVGRGAEQFAEEQGLEIVPPSYFFDSIRYQQLLRLKGNENTSDVGTEQKFGTVGCGPLTATETWRLELQQAG